MSKSMFVCAAILLSGCAAKPQLTYSSVTENRDGATRFTLPQSAILVTQPKQAGKRGPEVFSVPSDMYPQPKSFLVRGERNLLQETNLLNVSFIENTSLVSEVGFEVVSKTSDVLKVLTAVATIASSAPPATAVVEDTVVDIEEKTNPVPLPRNAGNWNYTLIYAPVVDGSLPLADFASNLASHAAVFPTSHCRQATFTLIDLRNAGTTYTSLLKIADPNRVALVRVPNKGSIKMHAGCGYNITVNDAGTAVDYDALTALVKFANDLKAKK